MILPIYQVDRLGARSVDGKVCIEDTSIRKYMPKYNKPINIINKITCWCETCISAMLLQSDLNKWRLLQLAKLDELFINSASTRFLQISKHDFIESES